MHGHMNEIGIPTVLESPVLQIESSLIWVLRKPTSTLFRDASHFGQNFKDAEKFPAKVQFPILLHRAKFPKD